ncbi:MAG: NUDIX domain-containing protein [Gemmatimonadaceae bacterium]
MVLYRRGSDGLEVFLVHPGGPYWEKKDAGAWSIPKGEFDDAEDPLAAARRELKEETGCSVDGPFIELGSIVQKNRKTVVAWAVESECDAGAIRSNIVSIEWPPRSGRKLEIPEVDRAEWFSAEAAKRKLVPAQGEFIDRLRTALGPYRAG